MNPRGLRRSALAFLASMLICGSAQAQLFRAYLASNGSDVNPCTVAAPCRLLPAALAAVASDGEIWMLDSANYNNATVNITKSVTILAVPGAVGSVVSTGGSAINIAAGGFSVALRNLRIVPLPGGGGTGGIHVSGAATLAVEDSVVSGHMFNGIAVLSATTVRISNCLVRDNGGNGVELQGGATASISGSQMLANGASGIKVLGTVNTATTAAITDSVLSGNTFGLDVQTSSAGTTARASITRSTISDNATFGVGVISPMTATAVATVGNNMITGNGTGLSQGGSSAATLESLGDNIVRQNTTPTSGTITPVSGT